MFLVRNLLCRLAERRSRPVRRNPEDDIAVYEVSSIQLECRFLLTITSRGKDLSVRGEAHTVDSRCVLRERRQVLDSWGVRGHLLSGQSSMRLGSYSGDVRVNHPKLRGSVLGKTKFNRAARDSGG